MSFLIIYTTLGAISMSFRPDAAPITVEYIKKAVQAGLYNKTTFYRSDFVIQCGLYGTSKTNPLGDIPVNEARIAPIVSNTRGTAAIAHWDVPDNGNTEFFINLQENAHLDEAYGGYCVFAEVTGVGSWATVDAIAAAIASKSKATIEIEGMALAEAPLPDDAPQELRRR